MSTSILAVAGSVVSYLQYQERNLSFQNIAQIGEQATQRATSVPTLLSKSVVQIPYALYLSEILLAAGFIGVVYYLFEKRKLRGGLK